MRIGIWQNSEPRFSFLTKREAKHEDYLPVVLRSVMTGEAPRSLNLSIEA